MTIRMIVALGLCLTLCGCMAFESKAVRNAPGYRAGYSDGCAAGGSGAATVRVDEAAMAAGYRNDKRYRAGYSAGFANCRPSSQRMPNLDRGPIADPYPGLPK